MNAESKGSDESEKQRLRSLAVDHDDEVYWIPLQGFMSHLAACCAAHKVSASCNWLKPSDCFQ